MTGRLGHITQQRLEKLKRIRARGINPYPNSYHRTHTTQEAVAFFKRFEGADISGEEFSLAGRIMLCRFMGKVAFMDLRDDSGKIQLYFRSDLLGEEKYQFLKELDIGDIIGARGKLFRTRSGEITLEVSDFTLLSKSLRPSPEKWHGLADVEKRYRQRYLDLIANEGVKSIFKLRSQIITFIRSFLDERGFLEVETAVLQYCAGGAAARPFVTYHQALDRELYLRIALELPLKRLIIGGFDKVYEIGHVFRNEGISTKHNPEFTMLECYEAYADYRDVARMVEEMVSLTAQEVLGGTKVNFGEHVIDLSTPWQRLPLREAIKKYSGIDFEDHPDAVSLRAEMERLGMEVDPSKGWGKLIDGLISTFVEPNLIQPVFLLDYPVEMSPLAKRKPNSKGLVERFETFIGGMEIANAFTELNDPLEQRQRFVQQMAAREAGDEAAEIVDEDFLTALEYAMPPTGGLGLGIDRLVMLFAGASSIREVIFFPQLKTKE